MKFILSLDATVEEARHDKSIRLYALPHGVKFKGPSQLKYLSERTKFAKNESVEFLCVAIRYLYMKGFRWKLDDTYLMPGYHWGTLSQSQIPTHYLHRKYLILVLFFRCE